MPTSIQYHGSEIEQSTSDESIHMFLVNRNSVNESISIFNRQYSKRTKRSKEFWLLDATKATYLINNVPEDQQKGQILLDFSNVPIDLDDDLYFFSGR